MFFADLVNGKASKLWKQDCEKLISQGLTADEIMEKNPHQDTYISKAVRSLNDYRSRVFEALEELKKESVG